jgi:hypothetical protein
VPLGQCALPSAHPISSETKVTEFGANPDGTAPGDAAGDAADAEGVAVMAGVVVACACGVSVGVVAPVDDPQAVRTAHATTTGAATAHGEEICVRVITSRNSRMVGGVTKGHQTKGIKRL